MRRIRFILIASGLAAVALIFMMRARADVVEPARSFNANDFKGTFAFHMASLKSFSAESGTSGLPLAPRQDILRVGVFTATPDTPPPGGPPATHGTLTGNTIATTDTNTGVTEVIVFTWTGEYKANGDGTGVFTVNDPPLSAQTCYNSTALILFTPPIGAAPGPPPPPASTCAGDDEGAETYAFVIKGKGEIDFIETDNSGGGAKIFMYGEADKQKKED